MPTMDQLVNVLLAIDNAHAGLIPQWALDCGPGLGKVGNNFCKEHIVSSYVIKIVALLLKLQSIHWVVS